MSRVRGVRPASVAVVAACIALAAACTDQSRSAPSSGLPAARPSTTSSPAPSTTVPNTLPTLPRGATWKVVFGDEFAGAALDPAHWATCYYWSSTTCTNASSRELELYTPKNVSVVSGELRLTARRELASGEGRRFDYTSGMISGASPTRVMFAFRYGYIEARARTPAGAGFWSALWLLPSNHATLPEVDVFENLGVQPRIVREYTHWLQPEGEQVFGNEVDLSESSAAWHVYGLDWEASALTWYVDGRKVWTVNYRPAVPQVDMLLLANLAVGGPYATPPTSATPFPSALALDYIKVWQHG